jgi:hypothetical protein
MGTAGHNKHLFYQRNKKEERNMSKSKIVGLMTLIAFAMGIFLVGDAAAREKYRLSTVYHTVKIEQMKVPGEEGHGIGIWEGKAVTRNKDGKPFGEGVIIHTVGYGEMNMKAGTCSDHYYDEWTDRDGDKIYSSGEGQGRIGEKEFYQEGKNSFTGGTGKYQGIRGEFTWKSYAVSPDQFIADWDVEVELSR